MTLKQIADIIANEQLDWRRMNSQPCVHTFYKEFYINLCLWHPKGVETISIDIDDINNHVNDIVSENLGKEDEYFSLFLKTYQQAIKVANNIAA